MVMDAVNPAPLPVGAGSLPAGSTTARCSAGCHCPGQSRSLATCACARLASNAAKSSSATAQRRASPVRASTPSAGKPRSIGAYTAASPVLTSSAGLQSARPAVTDCATNMRFSSARARQPTRTRVAPASVSVQLGTTSRRAPASCSARTGNGNSLS